MDEKFNNKSAEKNSKCNRIEKMKVTPRESLASESPQTTDKNKI